MTSKDYIVTSIVVALIVAMGSAYLFNSNAATEAQSTKADIATTLITTYEKAKADNNAENYDLSKVLQDNKIYNVLKKEYEKKMFSKTFSGAISGVATLNGNDITVPTPNAGEFSIILGTTVDLATANCTSVDSTYPQFISKDDAKSNAGDTLDECRGGVSDDPKARLIFNFDSKATAEKVNQKYFDNSADLIYSSGSSLESALSFKLQ